MRSLRNRAPDPEESRECEKYTAYRRNNSDILSAENNPNSGFITICAPVTDRSSLRPSPFPNHSLIQELSGNSPVAPANRA
jgi:hypothetical protein